MITPTWKNGRLYAIADVHIDNVHSALVEMCQGQYHRAMAHCLFIAKQAGYHSSCVSHALQMMADKGGPREFGNVFTSEEWNLFIERIGDAWESYWDLKAVLQEWSDKAAAKMGSF